MKLEGLKVNFLGDSITEGYGTTDPKNTYHQIMKENHGLKIAHNYGVGGTRIARQVIPSDREIFDLTFEIRAESMDRNVDLVVVFGGTNDYGHGDAHFGDYNSNDRFTFCGALNCLINKLKNDFPQAKIVFLTPIHRTNEETPSAPDLKTLKDYVDAMLDICKKHNVSVIDLFKINPLNPEDINTVPDGLHPNDDGHKILAQVIADELMKI